MIRYDQKVRGTVNRFCGFCYMDYESPGKDLSDKINDVYNSYLETPKNDGGKRKDISFKWHDFKNFTYDDYKRKNNWDLFGF